MKEENHLHQHFLEHFHSPTSAQHDPFCPIVPPLSMSLSLLVLLLLGGDFGGRNDVQMELEGESN